MFVLTRPSRQANHDPRRSFGSHSQIHYTKQQLGERKCSPFFKYCKLIMERLGFPDRWEAGQPVNMETFKAILYIAIYFGKHCCDDIKSDQADKKAEEVIGMVHGPALLGAEGHLNGDDLRRALHMSCVKARISSYDGFDNYKNESQALFFITTCGNADKWSMLDMIAFFSPEQVERLQAAYLEADNQDATRPFLEKMGKYATSLLLCTATIPDPLMRETFVVITEYHQHGLDFKRALEGLRDEADLKRRAGIIKLLHDMVISSSSNVANFINDLKLSSYVASNPQLTEVEVKIYMILMLPLKRNAVPYQV